MEFPKQNRDFQVGDRVYHVKEKEYGKVIRIDSFESIFKVLVRFSAYGLEKFRLNGREFHNYDTEDGDWIILTHD